MVNSGDTIYAFALLLLFSLVHSLPDSRNVARQGCLVTEQRSATLIRGILILSSQIDENVFLEEIEALVNAESLNAVISNRILDTFKRSTCPQGNNKHREKRGLIDAGGEVLKYILGVATSADVNEIRNNLDKTLKVHTERIDALHQMSTSVHKGMKLIREFMVEQRENKWRFLRHNMAEQVQTMCTNYQIHKLALEMGKFDPDLFNMTKLNEIIESYEYKWDLRLPQKLYSKAFGKLIDTRLVHHDGMNTVILTIPLIKNNIYRVFRLVSLPMVTKKWDKHKFSVLIKKEYVLISIDRSVVGFGNQNYINKCNRHFGNEMYCLNLVEFEIFDDLENNFCETNIVVFDDATNCDFMSHKINEVHAINSFDKLVISAEPKSKLTVRCPGVKPTYLVLPKSGVGVLSDQCDIRGKGFSFDKVKTHLENLGDIKFDFNVNVSIKHELEESHPVDLIIGKLDENLNETETLLDKENRQNELLRIHWKTEVAAFTSFILVCIVMTVGVVIISVWCIKIKCQLKSEEKPNTSTKADENTILKIFDTQVACTSEDHEENRGTIHVNR